MGPGDIPSRKFCAKAPFCKVSAAVPMNVTARPAARAAPYQPLRTVPWYCRR